MEVNKLLKRKQKAKDENNQQQLAEVCHKLGNVYMNQSKLDSALREFQEESEIYNAHHNKRLEYARAIRMVGEVLMLKERYKEAQKHVQNYLKISKELDDLVEQQRAYATIGRCYLLQAEDKSVGGSDDPKSDFKAAEKSFLKSLIICKELGKLVTKWELADMQARLYLNLGVTKEHMEDYSEAVSYYETAIKICKSNDLFELQHQCLMASGLSHSMKRNDNSTALSIFNEALEVSKRIQDQNDKKCETLYNMSVILVKSGDLQGAKQVLKKAYKSKSPNTSDREAIEKSLRIVLSLCKCEDELVTTNSFDYVKRRELFEKLGDGICKLKNYSKAIDFYLKSLESAELNGESGTQLIPIYVSLYQTYIDNKDYKKALEYMKKEFELVKDDPKEAASTQLAIANILDLSDSDFWEVELTYKKALEECRKSCDSTMEKSIMRKFINFCRKRKMTTIAEMLEQEAIGKGIEMNAVESSEEFEMSEDLFDINNDDGSELELSSDADSSSDEKRKKNEISLRSKRTKKQTMMKVNAKGETKLHEACINGNYQLAKMLIEQGHGVNVRDNAGWLPLHEASNHGYSDIVELLLDNGAQSAINDKGGVSCDGITPIHDAAGNGHLSTVLLLLDRGAKATMKTNYGETTLDILLRWHRENARGMTTTEKELYDEIRHKLTEQCERVGMEIKSKEKENILSIYHNSNEKSKKISQQSPSCLRYKAILTDDSENSDNEDEQRKPEKAKLGDKNVARNARDEYRNVMTRLKNPHKQQQHQLQTEPASPQETKRKSALLTENDVDIENWLEDDLGPMKKKQKFFERSPVKTTPMMIRKPSTNSLQNDETRNEDTNSLRVVSSDDDEVSAEKNAFDLVMLNSGITSLNKKLEKRKSAGLKPLPTTTQQSLLENGFCRFIEQKNSSPDVSLLKENQPTAAAVANVDKNVIIKVQVGEEKIIVPVNRETKDNKISWLIEETSRRYYLLKGIRPDLVLKTTDGATLLPSDTLSLIFSLSDDNVIHSEILDWKLPPLEKRYIEACSEFKCTVDTYLNELFNNNRSSLVINLSNQNLNAFNVRPIMKALQHQSILTELNLSNNFIQNDGVKFLSQTLTTLKCLNLLDISGNMVTENGVEYLSNTLTKSQFPSEIKHLNVSFNPMRSSSLKFISNICQMKNVTSLTMTSCDLSSVEHMNHLSNVRHLDISYNHFSLSSFGIILKKLNSSNVESLNLEKCTKDSELGQPIVEFILSGGYMSLTEMNLSGLELDENEILDILRCIEKCEKLKIVNFSNQKQLTCLSLKYILFNLDCQSLEKVQLLNCRQLTSVSNLNSLHQNEHSQGLASNLRHVQLSLPKEMSIKREFVEKVKGLWAFLCKGHERIEEKGNILFLLRDDDERSLPF